MTNDRFSHHNDDTSDVHNQSDLAGNGRRDGDHRNNDLFDPQLDALLRDWHNTHAEDARHHRDAVITALTNNPRHAAAADVNVPAEMLHASFRPTLIRRIMMNRYSPAAAAIMLLASLVTILLPSLPESRAQTLLTPNGGKLDARNETGQLIGPCPLEHTDVNVDITGQFARVTLVQRFTNPYDDKIEAVYSFPLGHNGAVDRMTMTVGNRVVVGEVHERQRARQIYLQARAQGHVAGLLEQERPNIFTQSVANIEPGAVIDIEISYVEMIESHDGEYQFAFPMTVAPRYMPGGRDATSDTAIDLPQELADRFGLILLGPSEVAPLEGKINTLGLTTEQLTRIIHAAIPIEPPVRAEGASPELACQFQATYADGSIDYGLLYADGTGFMNDRWFYMPLAAVQSGTGMAAPTAVVPDAHRISPKPVPPETRAGHDISLRVNLHTGGPGVTTFETPLHNTAMTHGSRKRDGSYDAMTLQLADGTDIPNRDFILKWRLDSDAIEEAVFTHASPLGGFVTLVLDPPEKVSDAQAVPRELIFLLDTSGSMGGLPIEKAKEVIANMIDSMRADDTFNIITFAGDTHILWDQPQPATADNRAEAQAFIASREGRGGTEMLPAIEAALTQTGTENLAITIDDLLRLPSDGRDVRVQIRRRDTTNLQDTAEPTEMRLHSANLDRVDAVVESWTIRLGELDPDGNDWYVLDGKWTSDDRGAYLAVSHGEIREPDIRPSRIVMFLTDGEVGNDMQIIDLVKRHADTTRVFSFGIGNSVNRYLLGSVAKEGRGVADFVSLDDEAVTAVDRFVQRIETPVLTDIRIETTGITLLDVTPSLIPDLFDRQPIVIHARYEQAGSGKLIIRGQTGAGPYARTIELDLPANEPDNDVLATLWARSRVEDLMNQNLAAAQSGNMPAEIHDAVVELGETYQIMTQYTSFVAVEKMRLTVGGEPRLVAVPIEFPDGQDWEGTMGQELAQVAEQYLALGQSPAATLPANLHQIFTIVSDDIPLDQLTQPSAETVEVSNADEASDTTPRKLEELRKLKEEIETLTRTLERQPTDRDAQYRKYVLEDYVARSEAGDIRETKRSETSATFFDMDDDSIPWHSDMIYPKDWKQVSSVRYQAIAQADGATTQLTPDTATSTADYFFSVASAGGVSAGQSIEFVESDLNINGVTDELSALNAVHAGIAFTPIQQRLGVAPPANVRHTTTVTRGLTDSFAGVGGATGLPALQSSHFGIAPIQQQQGILDRTAGRTVMLILPDPADAGLPSPQPPVDEFYSRLSRNYAYAYADDSGTNAPHDQKPNESNWLYFFGGDTPQQINNGNVGLDDRLTEDPTAPIECAPNPYVEALTADIQNAVHVGKTVELRYEPTAESRSESAASQPVGTTNATVGLAITRLTGTPAIVDAPDHIRWLALGEPGTAAAATTSAMIERLKCRSSEPTFADIPIEKCLQYCSDLATVNFHADWPALKLLGIVPETRVSLTLPGEATTRQLLNAIFSAARGNSSDDILVVVTPNGPMITTPTAFDAVQKTHRDRLVRAVWNHIVATEQHRDRIAEMLAQLNGQTARGGDSDSQAATSAIPQPQIPGAESLYTIPKPEVPRQWAALLQMCDAYAVGKEPSALSAAMSALIDDPTWSQARQFLSVTLNDVMTPQQQRAAIALLRSETAARLLEYGERLKKLSRRLAEPLIEVALSSDAKLAGNILTDGDRIIVTALLTEDAATNDELAALGLRVSSRHRELNSVIGSVERADLTRLALCDRVARIEPCTKAGNRSPAPPLADASAKPAGRTSR